MNPVIKTLLLGAVRPVLDLNFLNAATPGGLTVSGGANGTVVNSSGAIAAATALRFDYDPVSGACKGLLMEEARANMLLNSLIDGTSLSTQGVTVTNVAHTLSFYGAGTVTLSGASTAGPLVGSAVYPTRSTLTFTPSAGTLTLTVSGSVQYAKLEVGSFATSFTPTAGAAVTRTIDAASMTGGNFTSWFNPTEGTFVLEADSSSQRAGAYPAYFGVHDGTGNNAMGVYQGETNGTTAEVITAGVQVGAFGATSYVNGNTLRVAFAYGANNCALSIGGGTPLVNTSVTIPSVTTLQLGGHRTGNSLGAGHIRRLRYYRKRLSNSTLQRLTA